jgi:hemoglobin
VPRPSIYEFAGGDDAWVALTTAFHELCMADPELNHPFSHSSPEHVDHLATYWAEVFGGPRRYSGSLGGHSGMLAIHAGQGASEDLSTRFVACFMQAADDAGLPDDPEFRAAIRSYIEWAVREVDSYQAAGSVAPTGRPMPRWSWSGLET